MEKNDIRLELLRNFSRTARGGTNTPAHRLLCHRCRLYFSSNHIALKEKSHIWTGSKLSGPVITKSIFMLPPNNHVEKLNDLCNSVQRKIQSSWWRSRIERQRQCSQSANFPHCQRFVNVHRHTHELQLKTTDMLRNETATPAAAKRKKNDCLESVKDTRTCTLIYNWQKCVTISIYWCMSLPLSFCPPLAISFSLTLTLTHTSRQLKRQRHRECKPISNELACVRCTSNLHEF